MLDDKLNSHASKIKLLVSDIDGVWTDGTVIMNADGGESVVFSILDGFGIVSLIKNGIEVAIISGRDNPAVAARAKKLGVSEVHLGFLNKGEIIDKVISARGLDKSQVAAIGDDLPDLEMFERCGLNFAPPNAVDEIKGAADYVCTKPAGKGAVREACDLLLAAKDTSQ
ncbi:MAG: HAD-IIIA family hydrolase [Planctomycetota bacterium]|jgi:3-deoxy-D-manno-octulosonate 8-phosphate phosphatase (KDO 8-P phosphatase)|nr:HAD-IIIA family hydrolase [Planctomycetota bacterium]